MKRHPLCKLDIIQELELTTLYSLGFSTWMLSKLYNVAQWTPQNTVHKIHKIGLLDNIRNNEESVRARYSLEGRATTIPIFPSTKYIPKLIEHQLDKYFDRLIVVLLLTDGCVYKNQIHMVNNSEIIHRILFDMLFSHYKLKPTSFCKGKRKNYTTYVKKDTRKVVYELQKLTSIFKTSPSSGLNKEEYLSSPQPSLDSLLKTPLEIQIEALRLGFSTEGSITPFRSKKKIRGVLSFACTHPILTNQWLKITKNLGFTGFYITYNKNNWSGISGIRTSNNSDLNKFLNIGGFISGVKIGRGSPYYCGLDKQSVLKALLIYQKQNKKTPLSLKEHHYVIRKIAENVN